MDLQSLQPLTRPLNRQTIRASLHQLLAGLGASGSEVAQTLQAAGVRGTQRDIRDCALASYLRAIVTGEMRVRSIVVRGPSILVHRTGLRPAIWLSVPDPVECFITDFDRGKFPELIRGGESRDLREAPAT